MCLLGRESYTEVSSPKIEIETDNFYGIGAIHIICHSQLEGISVANLGG